MRASEFSPSGSRPLQRMNIGRLPLTSPSTVPAHQQPYAGFSSAPMSGSANGSRTPYVHSSKTPMHRGWETKTPMVASGSSVWDSGSKTPFPTNSGWDAGSKTPAPASSDWNTTSWNAESSASWDQTAFQGSWDAAPTVSQSWDSAPKVSQSWDTAPKVTQAWDTTITPNGAQKKTVASSKLSTNEKTPTGLPVDWPIPGILVNIGSSWKTKTSFEDGANDGEEAEVERSLGNNIYQVRTTVSREQLELGAEYLEPVAPNKKDKVVVLDGKNRGRIGKLETINVLEGVVDLGEKEYDMISIHLLAKQASNV